MGIGPLTKLFEVHSAMTSYSGILMLKKSDFLVHNSLHTERRFDNFTILEMIVVARREGIQSKISQRQNERALFFATTVSFIYQKLDKLL